MQRLLHSRILGPAVAGLLGTFCSGNTQKVKPDTSVNLPVVMVEAPRLHDFMAGRKIQKPDSAVRLFYASGSLADALAGESPIFIKAYGPGLLATPAWRGGSAYHSPVVWNGIPLTSPMNGVTDFSLIPLEAADILRLDYGAGSALWGSGAVAGAVQLISRPVFGEGLTQQMRLSWGSFGDVRQNLTASFGSRHLSTVLKVFHAVAENNFPYRVSGGEESHHARLPHAQVQNAGLISENSLRLGRHQVIYAYLWLQNTRRNIPPTLLQSVSRAAQEDRVLRSLISWNTEKGRLSVFVRTAWLQERLIYADPLAALADTSRSRQWVTEAEGKLRLGRTHILYVGLHNTHAEGYHPAYAGRAVQNRFAQMAAYHFSGAGYKIQVDFALRHELVDVRSNPLTGTLGLRYNPRNFLGIKASLARVYRLPTLNDLYWRPGGNPQLKPESGYAVEAGLVLSGKIKILGISSELTAYSRTVDHWIIWLPEAGYWTPRNVRRVWSRGTETHTTLSLRTGKVGWLLTVLTSYVLSTPTRSETLHDQAIDRQLIYTPMYTGMVRLMLTWKDLRVAYRHSYVGYRYLSSDNTQYLPPYDLGTVMLAHTVKAGRQADLEFFMTLHNIWNTSYQVVSQRPMPGFNLQGGLSLRIHYPVSHHHSLPETLKTHKQ